MAVIGGPGTVRVTSGRRSVVATAALDDDGVLHVAHGPSTAVQRIDLWCVDALAQRSDSGRVVVEVTERGTSTKLTFDPATGSLAQRVLEVIADIAGPSDE
jgi:hypothetical protein